MRIFLLYRLSLVSLEIPRCDLFQLIRHHFERREEPWEVIRDRHGNPGRDLVLLAARQFERNSLWELAQEEQVDYGTV